MSCEACATFQNDPTRGQYFYRWKHANVEIVACAEHAREIMGALNHAQAVARSDRELERLERLRRDAGAEGRA